MILVQRLQNKYVVHTYICPRDAEKIHSTTCMLFYFIVKGKSLFQIIFAIKIIVKSCRYQTSTQTNIVVVEKNGWENVDPPKIKILIRDSLIQQEINCRVNTILITITLLQIQEKNVTKIFNSYNRQHCINKLLLSFRGFSF